MYDKLCYQNFKYNQTSESDLACTFYDNIGDDMLGDLIFAGSEYCTCGTILKDVRPSSWYSVTCKQYPLIINLNHNDNHKDQQHKQATFASVLDVNVNNVEITHYVQYLF